MQVLQSRRAAGLVKDDVKERIERNPIELPDVTCSASTWNLISEIAFLSLAAVANFGDLNDACVLKQTSATQGVLTECLPCLFTFAASRIICIPASRWHFRVRDTARLIREMFGSSSYRG